MIHSKNSSLVLLICMIILAVVLIGWGNRGQASARVGWEYKIVKNYGSQPGDTGGLAWENPERYFSELGADGWEFVQFVRGEGGGGTPFGLPHGVWILKRPR